MLSPETPEEIMNNMPKLQSRNFRNTIRQSSWDGFQRYCDKAQLRLIERHMPTMNEENLKRAMLTLSGQYHGQKV